MSSFDRQVRQDAGAFLAMLAPERARGEALSSWFVRIAWANLLTLPECAALAGLRPQALDRGSPSDLQALADSLGLSVETLRPSAPWPSAERPKAYGPSPPRAWAVCASCLQDDVQARRPAHVRNTWTAPLAAYCFRHRQPLASHRLGGLGLIDEGQLKPAALDEEGAWKHLLDLDAEEARGFALLARAAPVVTGRHQSGRKTYDQAESTVLGECLDLIDALATRSAVGQGGAVIGILHRFWRLPRVCERSQHLDRGMLAMMDAADRLVFVRAAARLWAPPTIAPSWLAAYIYARGLQRMGDVLGEAAFDPLIVLGFQLSRQDQRAVSARAQAWGPSLARRWARVVEAAEACPKLI